MIYFHRRFDRKGVVYYATYGQDHLCAIEKMGAQVWAITVPERNGAGKPIGEKLHTEVSGDMERAFDWVLDNNQELHLLLRKPPPQPKRKKSD